MQKYPQDLTLLISHLRKLPGVGLKTAERFAFELLNWKEKDLQLFATHLKELPQKITPCTECGCLTQQGLCPFCSSEKREKTQLCLLSSAKDVYAMEETHSYKGLYHVIENLISPIHAQHADTLRTDRIEKRIEIYGIQEVIFAFDSTLEGDATALYLKNHFQSWDLTLSRLAFGLPLGSNLDYVDGGTLAKALVGRQPLV